MQQLKAQTVFERGKLQDYQNRAPRECNVMIYILVNAFATIIIIIARSTGISVFVMGKITKLINADIANYVKNVSTKMCRKIYLNRTVCTCRNVFLNIDFKRNRCSSC